MQIDPNVVKQIMPDLVTGRRIIDIGVVEGIDGICEFAIELVSLADEDHIYMLFTPGHTGWCSNESLLTVEVLNGREAFRKASSFPDDFCWWSTDENNTPG